MVAKAIKNKANPGKKSDRHSGKSTHKPAGKSTGKKVRNKAAKADNRKSGKVAGKRSGKGSARNNGRKTVEKIMSAFEDARHSDVSDKVFVATSPVHGKGLFAAKRIKADTVLGRLHGMPSYDDGIYVLWITDDLGLELTNDLRFINHDKNPNAAYSDVDVVALRDIEPGEELLHDYGW